MKFKKRMLFLVCKLLLSVAATGPVAAQTAVASGSTTSLSEWKTSDEATFTGKIVEVISKPADGAPAGVNLQLQATTGVLYASLGTCLSNSVKQSLTVGADVQAVGIARQIAGQSYLLVRQLVLEPQSTAAQKIIVRNAQGFPTHAMTVSGNRPRRISTDLGGAR